MHWPAFGRCLSSQITEQLKQYQIQTLEDVRIIRDRRTGASRQFGFIRFPNLEESVVFLERNYPTIFIYGNHPSDNDNQAAKVRIAYSRERETRNKPGAETEWMCPKCNGRNYSRRFDCFRCSTPKPDAIFSGSLGMTKPSHFTNTGDSDVSPDSTPSQYLIFRNLEPGVTEEVLATGAAKLLKSDEESAAATSGKIVSTSAVAQSGARQGCIRRILLVRDRRTDESWRYGFAELMTVEDAQAALAKFNSLEKFTIASHPVLVDYIHAGVFKPYLKPSASRASQFSFHATANPSLQLIYWDEDAYVKELVVATEDPDNPKKTKSAKNGSSAEKPTSRKGATDSKAKKRKAESADDSNTKKSVPSHLQFWANRHAELHGIEPTTKPEEGASDTEPVQVSTAIPAKEDAPPQQSFRDPVKHCCYLCARQFKTAAEVNKHERLSQLHQDNLQNADLVAKGLAKLQKAGITSSTAEYRDRAKERRAAFNQPKQPGSKPSSKTPTTTDSNPPPPNSTSTSTTPPPPQANPQTKGAALLSKMGWTAGSGLGAHGTGMTAPLATAVYAEGVGLGAEGGRRGDAVDEAARNTRGDYKEFLARTREGARERFGRLDG